MSIREKIHSTPASQQWSWLAGQQGEGSASEAVTPVAPEGGPGQQQQLLPQWDLARKAKYRALRKIYCVQSSVFGVW